jgi:MFS family permease
MRQHGTSTAVIGLVQAAIMAGGLIGGLVAPGLQGRMSVRTLTIVMFVAETLLFGVAALLIPSPLVALPVAIVPLLAPAGNAALFAVMLRSAPEEMRGRVTNTVSMVAMALAALAPLVAGLLVQHTSGGWAIGAFAATMAVATVLCLMLRGLRDVDSSARAVSPGGRSPLSPETPFPDAERP